jgi:large subunit ribosomal protein L6
MEVSAHPPYEKRIEVPTGCKVSIEDKTITVTGPKGTLKRTFSQPSTSIALEGNELVASTQITKKRSRALVGTVIAHARNMFQGVLNGYTFEMKIVYSHFPINVEKNDKDIIIKNFLGERGVRRASICEDVDVQIREDDIIITGIDLEHVSQSAASIQQSLRLRGKDKRVFMDGVYVIRKRTGDRIKAVV